MAFTETQLAQVRENSTSVVSVYSPPASTKTMIKTILLCNTTNSSVTYRLYMDDVGGTYSEATALAWDIPLAANTTDEWCGAYPMSDPNGNLAYKSSVANAITITVFGAEIT